MLKMTSFILSLLLITFCYSLDFYPDNPDQIITGKWVTYKEKKVVGHPYEVDSIYYHIGVDENKPEPQGYIRNLVTFNEYFQGYMRKGYLHTGKRSSIDEEWNYEEDLLTIVYLRVIDYTEVGEFRITIHSKDSLTFTDFNGSVGVRKVSDVR